MTASSDTFVSALDVPRQRVPDFFIVGHAKSGTTALYEMLRKQSQIFMPAVKEPWFFVPELRSNRRRKSVKHPDTLEEYLALFGPARPDQTVGEATPSYLFSRTAARRIAEVQPDARIIAILREPASFLRSLHLQFVQTDVETEKSFRRAIELEEQRRTGSALPRHSTRPQMLLYSEHVRYVEQLRRYHEVFAHEQVMVLIYDEFRANNEETVRRVLRFLGVRDTDPVEVTEANPTVQVRSPRLNELIRSLYLGREPAAKRVKTVVKALTPQQFRRGAMLKVRRAQLGKPRAPDEELMRQLRHRFKGEVVALSEYLDRDLVTLWGYDNIE